MAEKKTIGSKTLKRSDHDYNSWITLRNILELDGEIEEITLPILTISYKKPKFSEEERFKQAVELLEANDIELPITLGSFGTYTQYELAGESVNFSLLEENCDEEMSDEVYEKLCKILDFITEDWVEAKFGDEGQNELILEPDGTLSVEDFDI